MTTLVLSEATTKAGRRANGTNRTLQFATSLTEGDDTSIMYAL
jgi:hypothetical protein